VILTSTDSVQLSRLYLNWPTNPNFDRLQAPTDILSTILGGGKSSRLYKSLVYERRIAREISVYDYGQEIAGEFTIQATANPGHTLDEIEAAIIEEIQRMQTELPSEAELARAKNRIETSHVMQLERFGGFGGRADQLNYYNTFTGDPESINTNVARYMAVEPEDIREAAALLGRNQVKLAIHPEASHKVAVTTVNRSEIPTPAPQPRFTSPVPRRGELSNGLKVVHLEKNGVPVVAFGLIISGGALTDPEGKSGLASLTANMLAEGTGTRNSIQLAEELEFLGTSLRNHANREYAAISSDSLKTNWRDTLSILADVALNSTFPDHELERLRKNLLTDLDRIADNPMAIAGRAARSLYYGPGTPYGHPLSGNSESVASINRDDLLAYYASHFGPDNATFVVVGDLTFDEAMEAAESSFGGWKQVDRVSMNGMSPNLTQPSATQIYLADKPGAAQSVIRAGHLTIPRSHDDYLPLNMLNFIFGGQFMARLNSNLRQDKGYSYGYNSMIDWSQGPSMFMAGGGVQTAVTKEALIETLKEFEEIKTSRPVTEQEFADARDGILRALPGQFETMHQVLQQLTRMVVFDLPDDYFLTFEDSISAVTLEQVHRAGDLLDTEHLSILVVGDGAEIESGISELGLEVSKVDYEGRLLD
jgi:zinc protease